MTEPHSAAFVDTNIFVYAFEKILSPKKFAAEALISRLVDENRLRLSTQVLQELFIRLTHEVRGTCSADEALAYLDDLAVWPVFTPEYASIREAALLSRDARISFWDALIVVAAVRSGASRLYTEDLNDGQTILGVEVVNPFRRARR